MQLGLPSRDYFLHLESEKDLAAYHNYMVDVAELLGANRSYAETELWAVVEFEQQLANVSLRQRIQIRFRQLIPEGRMGVK